MNNDRLNVKVVSNQNSVELTKSENKVVVTDKKQDTSVNVTQKETAVVTIVSKGPKGDRGENGGHALLSGSVYITGSLEVSSSVTAQSFTGSLFGTASNALTASFITPTGTNAFVQNGNSFGTTAVLGTNDNQNLQFETNDSVRMTISSSGRVGIGTTTPTTTLNVNGTTLLQGGQTTVRGSGATSATTAFRVENSNQDPELTILDNGNVGISTATPADLLTINSPSSTGSLRLTHLSEIETLRATSFHSALYIGNNIYYSGSGDPATNSLYAVDSGSNNRGGNLLLMRANNGTTALGGFYFYTAPSSSIANTTATLTENLRILPSASVFSNTRVGIGATPNTSYAFDIQSSAPNAGAARINGNNTVWIFDQASQVTRGTTSLARMFLVQMGPVNASSGTQTALTISQSINQSSTAGYTTLVVNANETGTGSGNKLLQAWQFNGTNLTVINNSGSLGIGTETPTAKLHISGANADNLFRISSPTASAALFISGSGNVGIGTTSPSSKLHISGADAIMTLSPIGPLPTTNIPSASFATSGSGADLKPYFWNGSTWTALF